MRHIATRYLWTQQKVAKKIITIAKEGTKTNVADIGTKHFEESVILRFVKRPGYKYRDGRRKAAPRVAETA